MEILQNAFLFFVGISSGLLVSGGVFTTLIALGLVPRFAGRTHTANHVVLYENCIIAGSWFATLVTIWPASRILFVTITEAVPELIRVCLGTGGFFSGCFVGCMALAIAEMLDGISIFSRRISFKEGIGLVILCVAIGKVLGSMYYFLIGISAE